MKDAGFLMLDFEFVWDTEGVRDLPKLFFSKFPDFPVRLDLKGDV
jgi:hypothetical protein